MAKQIVALQAALEQMAEQFPGSFEGYTLRVVESHQSSKADTSGTAKAVSASLATLTGLCGAWADGRGHSPSTTSSPTLRLTPRPRPPPGESAVWSDDRIERVRERDLQLAGGGTSHEGVSPVPEAAIDGHAFHTYALTSADGNVQFQFRHNVAGRSTYAEGTIDAAVFLAKRVASADSQRIYDMVDVLKSGAM